MEAIMKIKFLEPKRDSLRGWSRRAEHDGKEFHCSVMRGKRVRIAYKPRGPGAFGFWWFGSVRVDGKLIFNGQVAKSIGCRGLLKMAGVFNE